MSWTGTRVLVTGAGGFIGSHLTERLVELGAKVRALVHYRSNGSWGWLEQAAVKEDLDVVLGDVCDRDSVKQALTDVQVVYHLAACIAIPYSYQVPESFLRINALGTLNLLQAAREQGVELVIHTSTSEVYGTARYVPMDEAHPLQAQSPYAASKIAADKLVESFHLSFRLPVVTVRPFNTFGPRQSSRAIVPTIMAQALTDTTIRLGNVTPIRDMNYVSDTVEGFVRAAECVEAIGRTFNLGSGHGISVADLAGVIAGLTGKSVELEIDDVRVRPPQSEVERLVADSTAAREVLGWSPAVPLEEGLRRTLRWFQQQGQVSRPAAYVV